MAKVEIRVKIKEIQSQYKSPNSDFTKTSIIGVVEGEYPEVYKIDFNKKKQELLNELVEGMYVTCLCNLRGREVIKDDGTAMHFISLECWKTENAKLA